MPPKNLPNIFDYLDYVKYIRDYYEKRHILDRWFSYRYIQGRTGIDPGYLFKIFQGTKSLPQKKVGAFAKLFGLNKRETEFFNLLILYNKAKSGDEIKQYFERLLSFTEVSARKVDVRQYEYYTQWYNAAIRQLFSIHDFKGDFKSLAKMTIPAITEHEARQAVTLLCKLGFAEKKPDGVFRLTDRFLTTGEEWNSIAIRNFQQNTINLARKALDTISKELRDISTVTIALSPQGFAEAKERIKQFRNDMLELADHQEQPTGAYHINVQMFPIGKKDAGAAK